jgi:starch phosphorylase
LRRFTVRAALPEPLARLGTLVMNLRWCWNPDAQELFEAVDPQLWAEVGLDPIRLLGAVSPERLAALAADRRFLRRLDDAADDLADYLTADRWYQRLARETGDAAIAPPSCVAYFSPEYGIAEVLPQYSGGLGILAGDHLKASSDLGVPIIGVGLLYRGGYFRQALSADGWQQEHYPAIDPHGLPLTLLREATGAPVRIAVGLPADRGLHAQIWVASVGRVPLLLLDSDVEQNAPAEREVTDRLYGGGTEHRLLQEMLLGIGGVRALRAYCRLAARPEPEVFHTNEGHAGFLGLERIRELTAQGLTFTEALPAVRAGTVFTTHTPVPAGIDRFPRALVEEHFGGNNACPGVPIEKVLELGCEPGGGDADVFNMAVMGMRLAQRVNGVSRLHGKVSRAMFASLWPGFDNAEVPIGHITNGVHAPSWVAPEISGPAGQDAEAAGAAFGGIANVSDEALWATKRALRARLVEQVRARLRESWRQRGASDAELGWIGTAFHPDVLTIGFARRVPAYKRLTLMLRDPDRLKALLLDPERPVQIVIAGKAHPADDAGKAMIAEIVRFADDPAVRHRIAFLPNYAIGMARDLYPGCDVWLNNPLRPLEACGTSGMKAALNGALNVSVRDGWWDECFDGQNGWAIPTADGVADEDLRDDLEAAALYDLLENQVRARFYDTGGSAPAVPRRWTEMVRHTLVSLGPFVLASRMVNDYVERLYTPAAAASRELAAQDHARAKKLAAWQDKVLAAWPAVRVAHVETSGVGDAPALGTTMVVRAVVEMPGLAVDDVDVQTAYGGVDELDRIQSPAVTSLRHVGEEANCSWLFEGELPLDRTGAFGYTVRVLPRHELLAASSDLGVAAGADLGR